MEAYLHIFLKPKAGISEESIKEKMNLAIDWYKYSDYCWVVKTTSNVTKWQTRLKSFVEPDGTLLILKIDPSQKQGWIAKGFWEWLKKDGSKKS